MREMLVIAAVMVVFGLGLYWSSHTENKETVAVAETKIEAPAKSVQELQMRYAQAKLTPVQKKLVATGLSPVATYSVTIKTK